MPPVTKFGPFHLDPQNFELRRDGNPIKLDRTPLELLIFLVERRGKLVTREEAVNRIWGEDVFIEAESSLYTAVRKIRKALGDETEGPEYIQTVARKGYRFVGKVEEQGYDLAASSTPTRARKYWWWITTGIAVIVVAATLLVWSLLSRPPAAHGKIMLAVLPLQNLSGDSKQEYLADGVTEEVITRLGNLDPQHLGVIARTSAMHYKNTNKEISQISRELGVAYVLEGSVRRSGDRVRVTAQLIQSSDQTHLWAQSYDRDLSDVLRVESEISGIVAAEIRLTLSQDTHERLASTARVNPEAHDAYLRGLQAWRRRTRNGVQQAVDSLYEATQLDPTYAPAFAALARAELLTPVFVGTPANEATRKALDAAQRALELDDRLADAHTAIAFEKAHYEFDWKTAEREYRRAIELEPNNPDTHFFYSNSYLSPFGRHDQAIAEMQRALELDPLSTPIQSFLGRTYVWARSYADAQKAYAQANEMDPNFALNHERIAQLDALLGNFDQAMGEESKARVLSGEAPESVLSKINRLREAVARRGAEGYWTTELEILAHGPNPPEAYVRPYDSAILYTHLGDHKRALAQLEIAYAQRDTALTELAVEPQFDPLRPEAEFQDLVKRVGLLH
jgi:TolB-like protein/DNA-binding winged helix-turn-helix (wHTH) protein/Tfp pilus assembly protein PilF